MVLDQRGHYFTNVRNGLSVVVVPIQYLVDGPVRFVNWVEDSLTSRANLLAENDTLKAQQVLLQAQIQKLRTEQQENTQLQALLQSSAQSYGKLLVAELLAVDSDPGSQQMILNRGTQQGVYVGQPVLDASGVMGQVIEVSPYTSRILLITDNRSAIPVQDSRNGYRAIATGEGSLGSLRLVNVPATADFQVGDKLVSSGLDGRYPVGYPVGTISKALRNTGQPFMNIIVQPAGRLYQSRLVLLVWPAQQVTTPLKFGALPSNEGSHTKEKKS